MSSTYADDGTVEISEQAQQIIVGLCIVMVFFTMAKEYFEPEISLFFALIIVTMTGIISLKDALSGFSNAAVITIGALYFVVAAVEKSYVVDYVARNAFGSSDNPTVGLIRMTSSSFLLSSVFNNTPLVAVMMPIVRDWARVRGVPVSTLLMPLSFSVLSGGLLTMIGTSTNLTIQGLVKDDQGYEFPFFAPGYTALPCGIVMLVYMAIAAPYILPRNNGLIRELRDNASELVLEVEVSSESIFVGKSLLDACNSVGISFSSAFKIRRLRKQDDLANNSNATALSVEKKAREITSNSEDTLDVNGIEFKELNLDIAKKENPESEEINLSQISDTNYVERTQGAWGSAGGEGNRKRTSSGRSLDDENRPAREHEQKYRDILSPSNFEVICDGDIIFFTNAKDLLTKLMKTIGKEKTGLKVLETHVTDIPGFGTDLAEVVLSHQNPFVGRQLSSCMSEFNEKYGVAVISSRQKIQSEEDPDDKEQQTPDDIESMLPQANDARSMTLSTGDVLLCLTKDSKIQELFASSDFYVVTSIGSVPKPLTLYGVIPLFVFILMICAAASEEIDMAAASLTTAGIFFAGGWVKPQEIPKLIDVRLLMLMGCSISFAKSMDTSGLAETIASLVESMAIGRMGSLFAVYFVTLVLTEFVSNNAAAALMYPFAVALAEKLNCSYKPFVFAVLIAASAAYMSPIGYQTHVMVWAPGGYKFMDFVKFGLVPDLIYMVGTCLLVPLYYPF